MKIEIINQQNLKKINLSLISRYLKKAAVCLEIPSKNISVVLCDNRFITKINRKYFNKNSPTDVISFSLNDEMEPDYLGEVIVSLETAVKSANKNKAGWQQELFLYLIHGILHLIGYDDDTDRRKRKMQKKQEEVLRRIFPVKKSAL